MLTFGSAIEYDVIVADRQVSNIRYVVGVLDDDAALACAMPMTVLRS